MAINFDSVISNAKGAANIAKLKVTLGLKKNELNKMFEELGRSFFECTRNEPIKEVESASEDNLSSETENMHSSLIDYMADENIRACLEKIPILQKEIAALESQVLNEKENMKPISTPDSMQSGYGQANYPQDHVTPTVSGAKCSKCGAMQSPDNDFCENCGSKMSE